MTINLGSHIAHHGSAAIYAIGIVRIHGALGLNSNPTLVSRAILRASRAGTSYTSVRAVHSTSSFTTGASLEVANVLSGGDLRLRLTNNSGFTLPYSASLYLEIINVNPAE